jgi:hypothetical protein
MPALAQPTRLSPTQFGFLLGGTPGTNYTIIASTNVSMPSSSWFTVLVTNLPYSPFFLVDTHATNSQRYYRAKLGP